MIKNGRNCLWRVSTAALLRHTFKILVQSFSWWESAASCQRPHLQRSQDNKVYCKCSLYFLYFCFLPCPVLAGLVVKSISPAELSFLLYTTGFPPTPTLAWVESSLHILAWLIELVYGRRVIDVHFYMLFLGELPYVWWRTMSSLPSTYLLFPPVNPLLHGPELALAGFCEIEHTDLPKKPFFLGSPLLRT